MRVGVWLSAVAVVLLTVASALRTAQVEGAARIGRRLPSPSVTDDNSVSNPSQTEAQPTFKSRSSRRREEVPERDVVRSRVRSRPAEGISETPPPQGNNERFDSRRTSSRSRSRPAEDEIKTEPSVSKENIVRSRTRQVNRRPAQTTQTPLEISSPTIVESKIEIINSNFNDISKIVPKEENVITSQFRRRSSSAPVIINTPTTESINPKRSRVRVNSRTNVVTQDLTGSGTTNSISVSDKEPTTARTGDLRSARKLRYQTRLPETEANLTGEGLTGSNEIVKSSQSRRKASQQETQTFAPIVERLVSQSTEANKFKTTTLKVTKVVRRPLGRGKVSKPSVSKTQTTEEINEDDNYPLSFKALIQAKNASTQASSPIRESLSVKASQKVYNTYTPSLQSTQTGPAENKYSRLRKQKIEEEHKTENKTAEKVNEAILSLDTSKPKNSEYRPRGTYATRNKKSTVFAPSTTTTSPFTNQEPGKTNKYNRKFKASTTESPTPENIGKDKQSEDNVLNKPFIRPPNYSRRFSVKNTTSSETSTVINKIHSSTQRKITLPKTSYYTRIRTNVKSSDTATTETLQVTNNDEAQKKNENSVDVPLIYTLLKNPEESVTDKNFIINVNSKESQEKDAINEASDMTGESENMAIVSVSRTMSSRIDIDRHKYHANYKNQNPTDVENREHASSTVTLPVRNLQTRKYGRKHTTSKALNEGNNNLTSPRPRERNIRKFSDAYSKTTEASSNGIVPEPERPKSRFSSKYRASNVDKSFYKPTVPTITSSTAWLKFFVTDNLLTKSVEEPKWFVKKEIDVTTESISRPYEKASYIHEPSFELVEGEEIQLGPDLNAISFTQTRRTLSSADLRLSESPVKQSHVMNVEASQHSPSVTVSIFDALAEILTSTPRTGLSSTTEVTKNPILNTDVTQVLNGVSNINVNSAQGIPNQENFTVIASDVSTITKSVQNIVQSTPNVINSTVGADFKPSQNTQDVNVTPVNTPRTPIPTPTTPISARRPFAIKLLYSNTESPIDQTTTGLESASNQPTTDSTMMSSSALNIKSSSLGITTATNKPHAEKSTASHVLSLRTTTILPSIDEILLNSISSAAKQEMVISSMTSSTHEPRILTLDIDPETKQIRTEKPDVGGGNAIFKFIPIDEVTVSSQNSNVLKLATTRTSTTTNTEKPEVQIITATSVTESNMQAQQIQTQGSIDASTTNVQSTVGSNLDTSLESTTINMPVATTEIITTVPVTTTPAPTSTTLAATTTVLTTTSVPTTTTTPATTTTTQAPTTTTTATTTTTTTAPTTTTTTTPEPTTTTTTTAAPTTTTTTTVSTTTTTTTTTTPAPTTTTPTTTTTVTTSPSTMSIPVTTTTLPPITNSLITTTSAPITSAQTTTISIEEDLKRYQQDLQLLQTLLQATGRDPKNLNLENNSNSILSSQATTIPSPTAKIPVTSQSIDQAQLLQALLSMTGQKSNTLSISNVGNNIRGNDGQTTTFRSIEDDIRQFEEDTKLLKALLQATGQNPSNLNIPTLDSIRTTTRDTPTTTTPTTTPVPTTTFRQTTTQTLAEDVKQLEEDAKFLQALLQATGQTTGNLNLPVVSGVTSNVRIASNPQTTSIMSNPTTPIEIRPVYTTTQAPVFKTFVPSTVSPTLQPAIPSSTVTENVGISTTFTPFTGGMTTTFRNFASTTVVSGRQTANSIFTSTTDIPSTSTFSVEEDLAFLQNLKNVLNTNPQTQDPEGALANRVIALAVEKSLKEIQSGTQSNSVRTGKTIANSANNLVATTTTIRPTTVTTTTTSTTTTTPRPTTTTRPITSTIQNGPSIEDDIRQFQEDTKLLQALIKATGQDPSQFNIPTLPNIQTSLNVSPNLQKTVNEDLNLLSNLLASPSPLNEPFDPLTQKPNANVVTKHTDKLPFGAKIAVKDNVKNVQDDGKLLQTLIQLQGKQETTTQKSKLITGQTSDEALQKLIQQTKPTGMISEATVAPISLSTEYGKSNDALLAALLKEQGFGPTTASSLDEQLRLAALLNQVVVTPKTRRTTTLPPPPPPPAPRRPILDGLAWLWQQWRETAPGPGTLKPNRKPAPSAKPPAPSPSASSGRVNWFGSGPFVGNADDRPGVNRIPLEPPRTVVTEQVPGRGQLVSAAINVTRAFSQFLGAAIQGAAQTVQSVIRAGQKVATDVYTNGSGGSG